MVWAIIAHRGRGRQKLIRAHPVSPRPARPASPTAGRDLLSVATRVRRGQFRMRGLPAATCLGREIIAQPGLHRLLQRLLTEREHLQGQIVLQHGQQAVAVKLGVGQSVAAIADQLG